MYAIFTKIFKTVVQPSSLVSEKFTALCEANVMDFGAQELEILTSELVEDSSTIPYLSASFFRRRICRAVDQFNEAIVTIVKF